MDCYRLKEIGTEPGAPKVKSWWVEEARHWSWRRAKPGGTRNVCFWDEFDGGNRGRKGLEVDENHLRIEW